MSSSFQNFQVGTPRSPLKKKLEGADSDTEDPLSVIQSQSTELSGLGLGIDLDFEGGGIDRDILDNISETSSVSFELYDDKFSREKLISQIQAETNNNDSNDFNAGEFLLKYYKYRELTDISNGLGDLIKGIDDDLIELVNVNYLSFINLGKSVDGSLDLIHDIKIDLSDYLKNLNSSNALIDNDTAKITKLQDSRLRLLKLKSIVKRLITLNEMIECFDKLISKFDQNEDHTDMLKELVGLYFGINKMFLKLFKQIKEDHLEDLLNDGILFNHSKKMNGLKLEFKSLLANYLTHLRESNTTNEEIFEIFKLYQLLNLTEDFKKSL